MRIISWVREEKGIAPVEKQQPLIREKSHKRITSYAESATNVCDNQGNGLSPWSAGVKLLATEAASHGVDS